MAARERTHYQVLGVGPGASTEEIRRAHRQLARVLHPDRLAGSSDAERRLAERRMREVNAAWTTLSDPTRRREYDRRHAVADGRPAAPDAATAHGARSASAVVDDDPDLERARARAAEIDPDEPPLHPAQFWLLRRGPLVGVLLVAVLLFFVTAYAGGGGAGNEQPTTSVAALDCVRRLDGRNAVQVGCSARNDGRIVTYVAQPLDCPARTSYVVVESRIVCVTSDPTLRSNLPSTTGA